MWAAINQFLLIAEGYFTLVLSTYRFLISWQNHNTAAHDSWLEPRYPPGTPMYQRFLQSFTLFGPNRRPMAGMHNLLIGANAIIISGEYIQELFFRFADLYFYHRWKFIGGWT